MSLLVEPIRPGDVVAPAPGLYPDVDFDTYASWDAVNQTILTKFDKMPPAGVRHSILTGGKTTAALELGWLTHLATFEPDRYRAEVVAAPVLDMRTNKGKAIWADVELQNPEKRVVRFNDDLKARLMAASVRSHPTASQFLTSRGANEISAVWDEVIGDYVIRCKGRFDRYAFLNEWPAVGDLKSSRSAQRRTFEKSILDFGYHIQAAHYLAGLETLFPVEAGNPYRRFFFMVVESAPPHLCAMYELDDDALEEGNRKRLTYLNQWRECVESGAWPGYDDGIQTCSLPAWAFKVFDN